RCIHSSRRMAEHSVVDLAGSYACCVPLTRFLTGRIRARLRWCEGQNEHVAVSCPPVLDLVGKRTNKVEAKTANRHVLDSAHDRQRSRLCGIEGPTIIDDRHLYVWFETLDFDRDRVGHAIIVSVPNDVRGRFIETQLGLPRRDRIEASAAGNL